MYQGTTTKIDNLKGKGRGKRMLTLFKEINQKREINPQQQTKWKSEKDAMEPTNAKTESVTAKLLEPSEL